MRTMNKFLESVSVEDESDVATCLSRSGSFSTFSSFALEDVDVLLGEAVTSWKSCALDLAELCQAQPLQTFGLAVFQHSGLISRFHIDHCKLEQFLMTIEKGYRTDVPYHNRAHATSVLHFMYVLLTQGGVAAALGGNADLIVLASLVAAVVHDYEHLGVNNKFLEVTQHDRAKEWNNEHINENHHINAAWAVLQQPQCNFLDHLCEEEFNMLESLVFAMVLGTDMADSDSLKNTFESQLEGCSSPTFVPSCHAEVVVSLQMVLKCADLGHLATDWQVHLEWVSRLEDEFFLQGEKEKQCGIEEITFLMDRNAKIGGVSQNQVGFFEFVALPLFKALVTAFPQTQPMLDAVEMNANEWRSIERARNALTKRHTF